MPRWPRDDDARDDELEFGDEPDNGLDDSLDGDSLDDGDWAAEDDDEPTVECPYCGREIHEDAQRCPHCENYVSAEDSPSPPKPWWLVVGAVACLYAVYRWIVWYNGPGI